MQVTIMSVLLCLLMALVDIHSITFPYISFKGVSMLNYSYINLSLVGSNTHSSVQCHTDLTTCCQPANGDWYFPHGAKLPGFVTVQGLLQVHAEQRVELRQLGSVYTSGVYRCEIDTTINKKTMFVGLYTSGGDVIIQRDLQYAMDKSLTGKATLTCISTGGPATTVIWTRDSMEVEGGTTVLDNAEQATYTHTLTLNDRLGGLYLCMVSNNKPSEGSASIRVTAASAPTDLIAVQEGPTTIRVSWTPPTPLGNTTGYRIFYSGGSSGSVDVPGSSTENYLLTGVQNGANYMISFVGTSDHLPSDPVHYPSSIPLSPDRPNVVMVTSTATTISLSWRVSDGSLGGYELVWERDTSGKCADEDMGSSTITDGSTDYTIMGLEEDSKYTITVTATNAAGSAVGNPITESTKKAVPSAPPTSVSISNVTSSSITVQWGAVDCIHQNGDIIGYSVRYGVQGSENIESIKVSGDAATEVVITELINSIAYSFQVAAVNNAGAGVYSKPITSKDNHKGGDAYPPIKGCEHTEHTVRTAALVGGVVGGFVGGVLLTATLGAIIFAVLLRRRTKEDARQTSSQVARENKSCVSTSTNLAYGQVVGMRAVEYEMCGMPSGAAMAIQEHMYETIPT